ncbi:hypothetical protein AHAS_Ahas03G0135400 [Arachis hypogaea]
MNNINHNPISKSTNHESTIPDPKDGLLNEETLFDMSILGDEAEFPNMMQTDIEPQAAQVPSHVSIEYVLKMEFFTLGEAREFYTSYSRLKSFAIRKSKRFMDDHNHTILSKRFIAYLPSHRNMSDVEIAQNNSMRKVGISISKIYQSFAMQNGDVNAALHFFEGAARNDEKLFWRYEVADGSRLCDIIWSDGQSQEDYEAFGDVLAFDATYGRNKYNLPVIVLSGVNHHNQTCMFAAAMVSYAHHSLCAWHLLRNATAHVSQPRFTQLFKQCMLADIEVDEFEIQREAMVDECGVREVEWVMDLYRKKLSWATAYIRGKFFAGLRTTYRWDSLHAKLGGFVESRYGILDFVTNFQRCVDFLRDKEEELDFRSFYVLVGNDIGSLPETLVLKRWCKNAKNHMTFVRQVTDTGDAASRYRSRLGAFLDQYVNPHLNGDRGGGIHDPVRVWTKGTDRGNVSQVLKGLKKRKYSACRKLGHHRTRCPSAPAPRHGCRGLQPISEGYQAQPQSSDLRAISGYAFLSRSSTKPIQETLEVHSNPCLALDFEIQICWALISCELLIYVEP